MSKAKKKARATARPLTVAKMEGRTARPELMARVKAESMHGTNVPARVVERMGGSTRNARVSEGDSGPKMRPKRKPRTAGSEAAAAGIIGREYGSKGDGIKRLSDERIRQNRTEFFAATAAARKAQGNAPVASDAEASHITEARESYAQAIGQARARTSVGDSSGAEAWMREARKYRRVFRNQ
ncbi:hypothetical protein [Streptomyces sp. Midd1]|uniref:hypothetical protein n=1 Tax=Streptomyces sp. Midd3 TaxID=3161191 RepID=UPI0034DB5F3B